MRPAQVLQHVKGANLRAAVGRGRKSVAEEEDFHMLGSPGVCAERFCGAAFTTPTCRVVEMLPCSAMNGFFDRDVPERQASMRGPAQGVGTL